MTPSNPDNQQPLIYRIADALGVFHLVAPVNHHHSQDEIDGLVSALAGKANAAAVETALAGKMDNKTIDSTPANNSTHLVSSKGVYDALSGKMENKTIDSEPANHTNNLISSKAVYEALQNKANWGALSQNGSHANIEQKEDENYVQYLEVTVENETVDITEENMPNLERALRTPDAQPVDNSDNLVTSGAVAEALRITRMRQSINIPGFDVIELEKGIVYNYIFTNTSGESISLISCFDTSSLPVSERNVYVTENGDGVTIHDGDVFGVRICRLDEGVFVEYLGLFV